MIGCEGIGRGPVMGGAIRESSMFSGESGRATVALLVVGPALLGCTNDRPGPCRPFGALSW